MKEIINIVSAQGTDPFEHVIETTSNECILNIESACNPCANGIITGCVLYNCRNMLFHMRPLYPWKLCLINFDSNSEVACIKCRGTGGFTFRNFDMTCSYKLVLTCGEFYQFCVYTSTVTILD